MNSNRVAQFILLSVFIVGVLFTVYKLFALREDLILNVPALNKDNSAQVSAVVNSVWFAALPTLLLGLAMVINLIFRKNQTSILESSNAEKDDTEEVSTTDKADNSKALNMQSEVDSIKKKISADKSGNLGQVLLNGVCSTLDAGQGILYEATEEEGKRWMKFKSGYAFSIGESEELKFEFGEGIIGQVAVEGKRLQIEDVPENYIKIISGLGEASPNHLIVAPVLKEGNVEALLEIATFKKVSKMQIEFIEQSIELAFGEKPKKKTKTTKKAE